MKLAIVLVITFFLYYSSNIGYSVSCSIGYCIDYSISYSRPIYIGYNIAYLLVIIWLTVAVIVTSYYTGYNVVAVLFIRVINIKVSGTAQLL